MYYTAAAVAAAAAAVVAGFAAEAADAKAEAEVVGNVPMSQSTMPIGIWQKECRFSDQLPPSHGRSSHSWCL